MLNLLRNDFKKTPTHISDLAQEHRIADSEFKTAKLSLAFANVSAQDFLWDLFNRAFQVEGKICKKDGCDAVHKIFCDAIISPETFLSFAELAGSQLQAMRHLFSDETSDPGLEYRLGSILMVVQLGRNTSSEVEKEMLEGLIELWATYLTEAGSLRIFPNVALKLNGAIEVYSMSWCDFDWLRNVVWNEKEEMWHLTDSEDCDEVDGTYC